jgi:hypothetical protein
VKSDEGSSDIQAAAWTSGWRRGDGEDAGGASRRWQCTLLDRIRVRSGGDWRLRRTS